MFKCSTIQNDVHVPFYKQFVCMNRRRHIIMSILSKNAMSNSKYNFVAFSRKCQLFYILKKSLILFGKNSFELALGALFGYISIVTFHCQVYFEIHDIKHFHCDILNWRNKMFASTAYVQNEYKKTFGVSAM